MTKTYANHSRNKDQEKSADSWACRDAVWTIFSDQRRFQLIAKLYRVRKIPFFFNQGNGWRSWTVIAPRFLLQGFGILWIEEGDKIVNFISLADEKGLSPDSLLQLSDELKKVYIAHQDEQRYVTHISDREVVVIPSTSLLNNLEGVVAHAVG